MSKLFIKKDTYVGDTGYTLENTVAGVKSLKTDNTTNKNDIFNIKNKVTNIGKVYQAIGDSKYITPNSSNEIQSLELPAGTYVLTGNFLFQGNDLRYYLTLYDVSNSAYDNNGYVEGTITTIASFSEKTIVRLYLWISGSNSIYIARRKITAVRII